MSLANTGGSRAALQISDSPPLAPPPRPGPVYLGDDLYSRQPACEAVRAPGGSLLCVCKPANRKTPSEHLHGVARGEIRETARRGATGRVHRYRRMTDAPSRNGFVTDLDAIADLAACGRARWKVENETFNVLKTRGYDLERNFGHGCETLASAPVALDLPVFAMRAASDLIEAAWRRETGTRMRLFERLRTIAAYRVFPSRQALMTTLVTGLAPPSGRNADPTHNPHEHRTMTQRRRPQP